MANSAPLDLLPALMALRVQGAASPKRLGSALGVAPSDAAECVSVLSERGLAVAHDNPTLRYSLTSDGVACLGAALATEGLGGDERLRASYEGFLSLNEELLRVASAWQVRRYGGTEIPNDHSDASYDRSVLGRLRSLHTKALALIDQIAEIAPRFHNYEQRLTSCLTSLESGETTAFTGVMIESYHTVWFEWHQDFILTLGVDRRP